MRCDRITRCAGVLTGFLAGAGAAWAQNASPPGGPPAERSQETQTIEQRLNIGTLADNLMTGAAPEDGDFEHLAKKMGVKRVVCLLDSSDPPASHRELAAKAGLDFEQVAFLVDPQAPPSEFRADRQAVRKLVADLAAKSDAKTYVYDSTGPACIGLVEFAYHFLVEHKCYALALKGAIERGFSGQLWPGLMEDTKLLAARVDELPVLQGIDISDDELLGRGETITVRGVKLNVKRMGEGPPVYLLHGGPGETHRAYRPYLDVLAKDFTIVYYDERGCGLSSELPFAEAYTMEQLLRELESLRQELGHEKISLIGHSTGGILAVQYALAHRDRVDKLVVLSSWASAEEFTVYARLATMTLSADRFRQYHGILDKLRQERRWPNGKELTVLVEIASPSSFFGRYSPEFEKDWKRRAAVSAFVNSGLSDEVFHKLDLCDRLAELAGLPTLVMSGAFDLITPPPVVRTFADRIDGAKFETFERSGHWPFVEEHEKFIKTVSAFLKSGG